MIHVFISLLFEFFRTRILNFFNMVFKKIDKKFLYENHQYLFLLGFFILVFTTFFVVYKYENIGFTEFLLTSSNNNIIIPANFVLVILIIILGLPHTSDKNKLDIIPKEKLRNYFYSINPTVVAHSKERAIKSCRHFYLWWTISFILLAFMYLIKVFYLFDINPQESIILYITNIFNILSTLSFAFCLIIISKNTFQFEDNKLKFKLPKIYYIYCFIAFCLIFPNFLFLVFEHCRETNLNIIVSILVGLFGGFVFVRFTGRIDSKFMRTPGIIVYLFYFYSFLLIYYPFADILNSLIRDNIIKISNTPSNIEMLFDISVTILLLLGYIMKTIIAMSIIWLYKKNKMLFYFVRMNRLQKELSLIDEQFDQGFEKRKK